MLSGGFNAPLRGVLGKLSSAADLEAIGLWLTVRQEHLLLPDHHPELLNQQQMADLAVKFTTLLVGARVKRLTWLCASFSGRFLLLAAESAQVRNEALAKLKGDLEAWQEAQRQVSAYWRGVVKRSHMGHAQVEQLLAVLEEQQWTDTEKLRHYAAQRGRVMLQSKLSEDTFCVGRGRESRQPRKEMKLTKLWQECIDRGLANKVHRLTPAPGWQGHSVERGACLGPETYYLRVREMPQSLRQITSPKAADSWYSTTVSNLAAVYGDLALMRYAHAKGRWKEVEEGANWCQLAKGHLMAIRSPSGQHCPPPSPQTHTVGTKKERPSFPWAGHPSNTAAPGFQKTCC
jgi:hypothetical protein